MINRLLRRIAAKYGPKPAPKRVRKPSAMDMLVEALIEFEGMQTEAYKCSAGRWTLGVGATRGLDGKRVKKGDTCTKAQAKRMLRRDAEKSLAAAKKLVKRDKRPVVHAMWGSLIYNAGRTAVARSKALKAWNEGDMTKAHLEYFDFCRAGGRKILGLLRRREKEWKRMTE